MKPRDLAAALSSSARDASPKQRLDVFANWAEVLEALEGSSQPGASALARAVYGSQRSGGVGFSSPKEVVAIGLELAAARMEDLRKRATAPPLGSDDEVGQRRAQWVLEWYGHIREFYAVAARKRQAVVCVFR